MPNSNNMVMSAAKIDFQTLSPFGVEAKRLSINDLKAQDLSSLKTALADHGFIVFRKQPISDADFVAFLKRLGKLTFTAGETLVPHEPALNIVSNIGRVSPPRSVFHTDTSYIAQPPAYTALRAVTVPVSGGGTLFSDQYLAYETLPSSVKEQLADVSGLTLTEDLEKQSWHPLFKRHPISGRIALFLTTPERCQTISGIPSAAAARMMRLLYKHSIRHYRLYYHQWQPDDIVLWDNRCTMHRGDHSQVMGDRLLHRGLVLSEAL
jgi:taurine dioxygenase